MTVVLCLVDNINTSMKMRLATLHINKPENCLLADNTDICCTSNLCEGKICRVSIVPVEIKTAGIYKFIGKAPESTLLSNGEIEAIF